MTNEVLALLCRQALLLSSGRGSVTNNGCASGLHLRTCRWCNAVTIWQPLCLLIHVFGDSKSSFIQQRDLIRVWKSLSFDSLKLFSISSNCCISVFMFFLFSFSVRKVFTQPGNPSSTLLDGMKLIWQKLAVRAQLCYVWIRPKMKQEVRINWPGWQVLHFFKRAKQPWEKYGGCTVFSFLANIAVV